MFQRADAYALSATQRFAAGFSAFWWSHVPKSRIRAFLRAFHRVLAPGARVLFIDNAYVEGSSTRISRRDAQGNTYQLRRLDDGGTHEVLKNFPTESELETAVEGLALHVQTDFLAYYWTLTYLLPTDTSSSPESKDCCDHQHVPGPCADSGSASAPLA